MSAQGSAASKQTEIIMHSNPLRSGACSSDAYLIAKHLLVRYFQMDLWRQWLYFHISGSDIPLANCSFLKRFAGEVDLEAQYMPVRFCDKKLTAFASEQAPEITTADLGLHLIPFDTMRFFVMRQFFSYPQSVTGQAARRKRLPQKLKRIHT